MNSNRRLNGGSQSNDDSDNRRQSPFEPRLPKYSTSSQHELIIDTVAVNAQCSQAPTSPDGPEREPLPQNPPPPYTLTQIPSPQSDQPPEYISEEKINELYQEP